MNNISEALESKLAALRMSSRAQAEGYEDRDHRRRFGNYERGRLRRAEPYFWTRQITDAVLVSSKSLPPDTKLSLNRYQDLQSGWFWFEHPVDCGGVAPFSALLWCVADVQDVEDNNQPKRTLVVSTYRTLQPGLPEVCDSAYLGDMSSLDKLFADDRRWDDPDIVAIHKQTVIGDETVRPSHLAGLFAFLLTALLWIDQTIVVAKDATADRATRRRLAREGLVHDPVVKVITLRRQSRDGAATDDGGHIEWSCQWIVRGHWRQQLYPSTGERRPLFILPYVKGPDDKPLKPPAATVFAVTR
jgi:hypothetical protein